MMTCDGRLNPELPSLMPVILDEFIREIMKLMDAAPQPRKHQRMRTLKDGQLISEGMTSLVDVKIRDLSASGARVETTTVIKLPEAFTLFIPSQKMIYPCRARWRRGMQIGIEFTGPPRPASLRKF
jgi:hypothetical protein